MCLVPLLFYYPPTTQPINSLPPYHLSKHSPMKMKTPSNYKTQWLFLLSSSSLFNCTPACIPALMHFGAQQGLWVQQPKLRGGKSVLDMFKEEKEDQCSTILRKGRREWGHGSKQMPDYEGPVVQGFVSMKQECNKTWFAFKNILANCCWTNKSWQKPVKAKKPLRNLYYSVPGERLQWLRADGNSGEREKREQRVPLSIAVDPPPLWEILKIRHHQVLVIFILWSLVYCGPLFIEHHTSLKIMSLCTSEHLVGCLTQS